MAWTAKSRSDWERQNPGKRKLIRDRYEKANPIGVKFDRLNSASRFRGYAPLDVTRQEFVEWYRIQDVSRCACCGKNISKCPQIDHCHKTGKLRGILCIRCNVALGYFEDTTMCSLTSAYLERTS